MADISDLLDESQWEFVPWPRSDDEEDNDIASSMPSPASRKTHIPTAARLRYTTFIGGKWLKLQCDDLREDDWEIIPKPVVHPKASRSFNMKRYMEMLEPQKLFCFHIQAGRLATGCTKMCGYWDIKSGARLRPFRGTTAPVTGIKFAHSNLLVGAQNNGGILVWETNTRELLYSFKDAGYQRGLDVMESNLISFCAGSELRCWDILAGTRMMDIANAKRGAEFTCSHTQEYRITVGQSDGRVLILDRRTYEEIKRLDIAPQNKSILSLKCDGDNLVVSVGSQVQVWDLRKYEKVHDLNGHTGDVEHIDAFNNFIVSGSNDQTVRVWNAETGACISTLHHLYPIRGVQIVDPETIAAGGYNFNLAKIAENPSYEISSVVLWKRRRNFACSVS